MQGFTTERALERQMVSMSISRSKKQCPLTRLHEKLGALLMNLFNFHTGLKKWVQCKLGHLTLRDNCNITIYINSGAQLNTLKLVLEY